MKKIYILFIALFIIGQNILWAQEPIDSVILQKENIAGRWVEYERFVNENDTIMPASPYTYVFKDDMLFHRGSAANDVLIFNITGRYKVENDLVTVVYRDYMNHRPGANKDRTMTFRVIAWSDEQMTVKVKEPYAKEYLVILKKQKLS